MIASICSEPTILKVMKYVNIFISIIRIVIPIILIFVASFKFISVIKTGNEDELTKVKKSVIINAIAAVIIFLIPNFVSLIVKISFSENDYKNCLNVSDETITNAYISKTERLVLKAEKTLNINDYNNAYVYLKNVKNEEKRKAYEDRLLVAQDKRYIKEAEELIKTAEDSLSEDAIFKASRFLNNISDDTEREKLNDKIVAVEEKLQAKIIAEEASNTTGSLPGGDMVYIPPGPRPITEYVSVDEVNRKIAVAAKSSGLYTRGAVVAVATTLIKTLEASNYYIPYQLGGMYHRGNAWGVNPAWGTLINHEGNQVLSGLDCRNFVHWVFKQAGLSLIRGFGYEGSLKEDSDNRYSSISAGKPGDVIDANPHIMLVVSNNGSSYTVAESNGVGRVRLQEFSFNDLSNAGYKVYNMDAVYSNTGKYCPFQSEYRAYSGSCHIPRNQFPSYY